MKGTKKLFNALDQDCNLQSPECKRAIKQLGTLIGQVNNRSGYVFTHPIFSKISSKCNYLQSQTNNEDNIKALRKMQGYFDQLDHEEYYLYQGDLLNESACRDSPESFSDD